MVLKRLLVVVAPRLVVGVVRDRRKRTYTAWKGWELPLLQRRRVVDDVDLELADDDEGGVAPDVAHAGGDAVVLALVVRGDCLPAMVGVSGTQNLSVTLGVRKERLPFASDHVRFRGDLNTCPLGHSKFTERSV